MHRRTLVALLLGLLALGGLAWWQLAREARGEFPDEEPLCPGVVAGRVERIRIDHSEHDEVIVLERDAQTPGGWRMSDPLEYPAAPGVAEHLAELAERNRFLPQPALEQRELAALGLAPPRVVVRWSVREAPGAPQEPGAAPQAREGALREHEVELGRTDPDGERVLVRVRGRLGTTSRNLDTALQGFLDDYRSRAIVAVPPPAVIELVRSGVDPRDGEPLDAQLVLEEDSWWLARPFRARLDGPTARVLVGVLAGLSAQGFVDHARTTPAELGFGSESPRLELTTSSDAHPVVLLARSPDFQWLARRPGEPWIWRLDPSEAELELSDPVDWVDRALVRARRDDLEGFEIARAGERVLLRSKARGGWEVRAGEAWVDADGAAVADLLAQLDASAFGGLWVGEELGADPQRRSLRLVLRDGSAQELVLGATRTLASGEFVRELRRSADGLVGWVEPDFERLFEFQALELQSPLLLPALEESRSARIELAAGEARRAFVRDEEGRWRAEGASEPARELEPWLDPLFFLRAQRRLPSAPRPALEAPLTVTIVTREGARRSFALGLAPGGEAGEEAQVQIELDGERALPQRPQLYQGLRALLGG